MNDHKDDTREQGRTRSLAAVRLGLLVMALGAGAALATPYSSASSCSGDCGCGGGSTQCCTLGNGATCYQS